MLLYFLFLRTVPISDFSSGFQNPLLSLAVVQTKLAHSQISPEPGSLRSRSRLPVEGASQPGGVRFSRSTIQTVPLTK